MRIVISASSRCQKPSPDPTRTPIPSLSFHDVVHENVPVCSCCAASLNPNNSNTHQTPSNFNLLRLPHPQPHSRHSSQLGPHPTAQLPPPPAPQRRRQEPRHGRPRLLHPTIPIPTPRARLRRSHIHTATTTSIRPKLPKKERPLLLRRLLLLLQLAPARRLIPQPDILVITPLLPLALLRRQRRLLVVPPPLVAQGRPREARGHGRRRGEERGRALLVMAAAVVHGVEALAWGKDCVAGACDDGALGADVLRTHSMLDKVRRGRLAGGVAIQTTAGTSQTTRARWKSAQCRRRQRRRSCCFCRWKCARGIAAARPLPSRPATAGGTRRCR